MPRFVRGRDADCLHGFPRLSFCWPRLSVPITPAHEATWILMNRSRETALYVLNYARAFQPRWIVIENVIQMRTWSRYQGLLKALRRDYKVRAQLLDAANFGVPQTRRRLFILCDRKSEPPDLSVHRSSYRPTAGDVLDPPGSWEARPLYRKGRASETLARAKRAMDELGEGIPFLIVYYSMDGGGGWQSLERPLRTLTTLDRFGLVEWQQGEPTLRMLQVPELQRAMGFSKDYQMIRGSRRDRIKLLGNGVCPPVMQHIVAELTGSVRTTSRESTLSRRRLPSIYRLRHRQIRQA